jgi:hypothetical protein
MTPEQTKRLAAILAYCRERPTKFMLTRAEQAAYKTIIAAIDDGLDWIGCKDENKEQDAIERLESILTAWQEVEL